MKEMAMKTIHLAGYSTRGLIMACATAVAGALADERPPQIRTLQPGVSLEEVVSHPSIATPTGIDVDDQGRVWAVACHTHFPPEDYAGPDTDEILVFDSEGSRTVFYTRAHHTMDLELGEDGWVYLAERDRILRVRDSDGDGKGDVEETLAELSTEADYPHNGLSALAWHPEGDLFFGLGENFAKAWKLTSRHGEVFEGRGEGGVFRCAPDGSRLRRVASGMWNPFGMVIRRDGEIFAVENDPGERPPCRLLHIVDGGHYGYQRAYGGGAHHPFVGWNGELRGTLPMVHPVGEGPCGVVEFRAGLLAPSWSDHRIDFLPLEAKGATFTASRIALVSGGRYFRPVCIAPDAATLGSRNPTWYLTDWVDGNYKVHGFGRIWRLTIDLDVASDWIGRPSPDQATPLNLQAREIRRGAEFSDDQLREWIVHPDPFVALAAQQAISPEAWNPEEISNLSERDRLAALLSLRHHPELATDWIPRFLGDPSSEVRFEALRWIADEVRVAFLPRIEELLAEDSLDYRLFEAAIATHNTLSGASELGVQNEPLLLAKVLDPDTPPKLKALALRLLPVQPRVAAKDGSAPEPRLPEGLGIAELGSMLGQGSQELQIEVAWLLAGSPQRCRALLEEIAKNGEFAPSVRAIAISGLAALPEAPRALLLHLSFADEKAVREEALRAMRGSDLTPDEVKRLEALAARHPDSADGIFAVISPDSVNRDRPAPTDLQAWLQRVGAAPGKVDLEAGKRLFFHRTRGQCGNCHRHGGRGNVVGPDLSRVGDRGDEAWLLESILNPNQEIAPEYLPRHVVLKDGTTHFGIRLRSSKSEVIRDLNGQNRSFNRDDIASIEELQVSFMPGGLTLGMTDRELRDLLAFLHSPGD